MPVTLAETALVAPSRREIAPNLSDLRERSSSPRLSLKSSRQLVSVRLLNDRADHGLRRKHERCDRRRILQSRAGYLGRIDYSGLDQVFVLIGRSIVDDVRILVAAGLLHNDIAFGSLIQDDLPVRLYP